MTRSELYQDTKDFLAYASLNAPEFPPEDEIDATWVLARLTSNLDNINANETNADARKWIQLTKQEITEAFRLYAAGDEQRGCEELTKAEEYLENAKKRKRIRADFIGGDENFGMRGPLRQ
jgi:hypothetical protein